jgi:hypothetical protein
MVLGGIVVGAIGVLMVDFGDRTRDRTTMLVPHCHSVLAVLISAWTMMAQS